MHHRSMGSMLQVGLIVTANKCDPTATCRRWTLHYCCVLPCLTCTARARTIAASHDLHPQRPIRPNTPENGGTSAQAEICSIAYDNGSTWSHGCMQCRQIPLTMDVLVLRGRACLCLRVLRDVLSSLPVRSRRATFADLVIAAYIVAMTR